MIEEVEFDFAAKLTALNAVTLASLARAPDLAGYEVYWRPTAEPRWRWSR